MKIIIIGGVAGGASAAARLRRLDENVEIVMLEKGPYISFANCGLPYYVGGSIQQRDALLLQTPEQFNASFNVDVRIQNEVISIDKKKKTVTVKDWKTEKEYTEKYDKLILSPGSSPIDPPIKGKDLVDNIFTLWTVPDVDKIKKYVDEIKPKTAVVVGGGFIGIEMVENLYDRGIEVSLVELAPQVMAPFDFEMAQIMHAHIEDHGVDLNIGKGLAEFKKQKDKKTKEDKTIVVLDNKEEISADIVIMSLGIRPQTKIAADAGLELNARGGIIVDSTLRTSDPDIFAVGDAIQVKNFINNIDTMIPLAGPANKQGRMVAANVLGGTEEYKGTQGTAIAKVFDLQAASTGLNEKTLLSAGKIYGVDFDVIMIHPMSHAGYYPDALLLSIKVLFDLKTEQILGAQGVGYDGVDKRIDVLATAIRLGAKVTDLTELELAYAPPFSSAKDPVNMIGFVAENVLTGKVRNITWDRIDTIVDPQILDVRTELEHSTGAIPGSLLIDVGDLRANLEKLDKSKPVIIYCKLGIRAYLAARILVQKGFSQVFNLSGGFITYHSATWVSEGKKDKKHSKNYPLESENRGGDVVSTKVKNLYAGKVISLDCSGLACPGPIQKVFEMINQANDGDVVNVVASDPGFGRDIKSWCKSTGNTLLDVKNEKGKVSASVRKGMLEEQIPPLGDGVKMISTGNDKTLVVFSGDLDKAIASFIIANGSAAMGRNVTMFFTFWGLNVLRRPKKVRVKKNFIEKMFGSMMPRGPKKLTISNMNMGGMGTSMIKSIMKKHNVDQLEVMIQQALDSGVEMIACTMSMDLMGIKEEELIDGITLAGVAAYLGAAETADVNLFI